MDNEYKEREAELYKICVSRGIFFPSAEVFTENLAGFWDYGDIGLRIFNNIIRNWRELLARIDAKEISGSVILPRKVLQASGHEVNFFDFSVSCQKCGSSYRADKLLEEANPGQNFEGLKPEEYDELIKKHKIRCKKCGSVLGKTSKFGTMFSILVGEKRHDDINAYLRPEACQSIFLDFKRIFDAYGRTLPLIIAQTGKAFRNELSPRNNLLRQREFYQSDIEIFFDPGKDDDFRIQDDWEIKILEKPGGKEVLLNISKAMEKGVLGHKVTAFAVSLVEGFLLTLGFDKESIRFRKLHEDKAFYAEEAFDVEIKKQDSWVEIISCNHRADHDLGSYSKNGATFDSFNGVMPNVFEISMGTDRIFYLLLEQKLSKDSKRYWLKLSSRVAPFRASVFPLLNKEELVDEANKLRNASVFRNDIYYLDIGNIGKMYRKSDEIGVPIAVTVDYQTLKDGSVTIRDRDDMAQFRVDKKDIDGIIKSMEDLSIKKIRETYSVQ